MADKKERVTLSLSAGSVKFLKATQQQQRSPSLSALVDRIVEKVKRDYELASLNASVNAYYNSLSEAERREEAAWGEVGAAGLEALEAEEEEHTPRLARAGR